MDQDPGHPPPRGPLRDRRRAGSGRQARGRGPVERPRVLALNCGSSTVKYLLAEGERRLAEGKTEGRPEEHPVHAVLDELRQRGLLGAVDAVGHRVVHGGPRLQRPTLVDEAVLDELERLNELAPLHNPPAVGAIREVRAALPGVPNVATFDTAFHSGMPAAAATYAVPWRWTEELEVRRYGFHGLAHRSMLAGAARQLERPATELRLVTFQLGSGCSVCAIDRGRSVETSMGFTPNEGLVMATRSGDLDPEVLAYVARRTRRPADDVAADLETHSGLAGIAGGDGDMRRLLAAAHHGDARARLALDVYVHRARKYLGAYSAVLGRVDAVVFGGGVGENAAEVRERIADKREVPVLVVAVDEQVVIRDDVEAVLAG